MDTPERMNIHDLVEYGSAKDPNGTPYTPKRISDLDIDVENAEFEGRVTLGRGVVIGDTVVGAYCVIGSGVRIGDLSYLGTGVTLEHSALICHEVYISRGVMVGALAVLRSGVVIGPDIHIPSGAQIGTNMVIPSPRTIMALGPVGSSQRIITVHGSDDGPRYSAGCQVSDPEEVFFDRIRGSVATTEESAEHYREFLHSDVLRRIGIIAQTHYDEDVESGLVAQLREQAAASQEPEED